MEEGNENRGYGQMPIPEMIGISDKVNGYIEEASNYEMKGDFENAILIYEMAIHADPQRLDCRAGRIGALISLRQKKIKEMAPEDDVKHIEGVIADMETELGSPPTIN